VPALFEHAGITLAQPLEQARGPLDIGEEQRHGAGWKLAHCIPPRVIPGIGRKMYTPIQWNTLRMRCVLSLFHRGLIYHAAWKDCLRENIMSPPQP